MPILAATWAATLTLPESAWATCTFDSGGPGTLDMNFGDVSVQRDTPVGAELAMVSAAARSGPVTCPNNHDMYGRLGIFSVRSPYGSGVFDTNIKGVGISLSLATGGPILPFPYTYSRAPISNTGLIGGLTVRLVKTSSGAVDAGALTTGTIGTVSLDALEVLTVNLTGNNTITPATCSVKDSTINVPMGDMKRSLFSGVGSEGDPASFQIDVDCDTWTRIHFKIDAVADGSNEPGVIALTPAGSDTTASGIGIKLTYNGTAVVLGAKTPFLTSNGLISIPLVARYYQTRPAVTAGQANGTATFTMIYE